MTSKRKRFQDYASRSNNTDVSANRTSRKQVSALDKLMEYLASRNHSEKELIQKLSRKYTQDQVAQAIEEAKSQNWLINEDKLSEQTALMLHRKKKGILYIQAYLRQKGLPPVQREAELELEKAQQILKNLGYENKISQTDKAKVQRLLTNRGFDRETIMACIRSIN